MHAVQQGRLWSGSLFSVQNHFDNRSARFEKLTKRIKWNPNALRTPLRLAVPEDLHFATCHVGRGVPCTLSRSHGPWAPAIGRFSTPVLC